MSLGGSKFKGAGSTLGGSRPGTLTTVSFLNPGPLKCTIEKNETGGAVVSALQPGQAQDAGVLRGDIVCWAESGGKEVSYEEFMAIVQSGERPLTLDMLRIPQVGANLPQGASAAADARKAAMVAAATKREESFKKKATAPKKREIDMKSNTKTYDHDVSSGPMSEEARKAVEAAKAAEAKLAAELGYNPYAPVKSGSGKGGGNVQVPDAAAPAAKELAAPAAVAAPPAYPNQSDDAEVPDEFTLGLMQIVSVEAKADVCLKTIQKLVTNAVTKGQSAEGAKFRTINTSNAAIKERVLSVTGSLELLQAAGFVLSDGGEELVYPVKDPETWLEAGMQILAAQCAP
jgi:pyruvate/2-oxoglutarate dehydrogenase complex dihydrolipoamide acyltransferase (E2) component